MYEIEEPLEDAYVNEDGSKEKEYLFTIMEPQRLPDFTADLMADLRVTDGALIVVDYNEGVTEDAKYQLRKALSERIKPALFINKLDKVIHDCKADGEAMYKQFQRIINDINEVISCYDSSWAGESLLITPSSVVSAPLNQAGASR